MNTLLTILIPAIGLFLVWIASKLIVKLNVSIDTKIQALSLVKQGIEFAESTAENYLKNNGVKIASTSKLVMALDKIDELAVQHPEARDYLKDKTATLVEKVLRSDLTEVQSKS